MWHDQTGAVQDTTVPDARVVEAESSGTIVSSTAESKTLMLYYCAETDSLCVELKSGPGAETREIADGLNVDLDAN